MGIKERRDTEKAEMKRKIMDASIKIIEQEGYEKLSIRKIAAKIEYSPTTIYLYYKDKAEIIADMCTELYDSIVEDTVIILNDKTKPIDLKAHAIMYVFIKGLCNESEMVKAIMYSGLDVIFSNANTESEPQNSGIAMFDSLFAEGIAQGAFRPTIAGTSWMIISAMLGFSLSAIERRLYLQNDFDQLVMAYIEILMGGMRL